MARSGAPYFGSGRLLGGLEASSRDRLCCVLHDGVYRTPDAGTSWEHIFEGDARAAAVDPSDDRVVYVGTEPVRLYRSEDKGDTWEELKHLLDLPDEIKRHWESPQPQYQGHVRPTGLGAVWFSPDVGDSWREIKLGELPPVRAMCMACP